MKVLTTKPNLLFVPKEEKEFEKKLKEDIGKKKQISNLGLNYLQGIETIDENSNNSNPLLLNIFIYGHDKGVSFKMMSSINKEAWFVGIYNDEVKKVYFVDGEEIVEKKSVIGRSISGALIAGPVGAIVGGISGLGENIKQEAFMVIETLETKVIFKCKPGTKLIFEKEFKQVFGDKLITSSEQKRQQEQEFLNSI
ncbi:hypothetical protein KQI42_20035 [Tissierella sp. MSJ-40]|uniref:Uncharacterized protein n=1 Tax=Tissierella simiarum TaxID=2841534 RepID=A0ABS6EDQ4_9FIRM|nr:hypothetical protein [Tissierella simiarum]MBU5440288.1 hypothetical protein [Tissierella simiarum]